MQMEKLIHLPLPGLQGDLGVMVIRAVEGRISYKAFPSFTSKNL